MMRLTSFAQLLILGAIWGSSFLFLNISVSSLGPVALIESRLLLAALFLLLLTWLWRQPLNLVQHWKHFLFLGTVNSAFPFVMLGYSAKYLPVSIVVVLNATGPIWSVLITFLLTRERPSLITLFGTLLGIAGVYILVADNQSIQWSGRSLSAICAGLVGTIGYAIASVYTARTRVKVESFQNAHGSMWGAALILLPMLPFYPAYSVPSLEIATAVLALGVICTGSAYLLYFKLIKDIGPTPALSVTYLIPMFGMLWGTLFLGEQLNWHHIVGTLVVLAGTACVVRINLLGLIKSLGINPSRHGAAMEQ